MFWHKGIFKKKEAVTFFQNIGEREGVTAIDIFRDTNHLRELKKLPKTILSVIMIDRRKKSSNLPKNAESSAIFEKSKSFMRSHNSIAQT